jgi:hypothetical protein
MRSLNLAAHPFRNERLGEALFAVAAILLLAVTAWHALVIRDLLPARTSALHREVAALQAELSSLRTEAANQRTEAPAPPVLAEWSLVKDLVDRRAFSWTGLFASLEEVIPEDVRLTQITPAVKKGELQLDLAALVRTPAAGWEFVRALEDSDEFYDVYPKSESDREFRYVIRYRPRREHALVGPPAPPAAAEEAAPASAEPPLVGPPAPDEGRP